MGSLPLFNVQATKMAFTDLIPALLNQSGATVDSIKQTKDFFKNQKPSTSLANQFQRLQESFQSIDYLLGQVRSPVVQLFLNPENVTVNKKVLYDKRQTRGGWVIQFWGHDLETIEVKAATAYFEISKEPVKAFELLKRQCYQGRFHSTQPFRGSPIIAMLFESQILKGFFTDFSYTLSASSPYYITYSFGFTVTENVTFVLGSNIANAVADIVGLLSKKGGTNVNKFRNEASILPEQFQFGNGWGVQLF